MEKDSLMPGDTLRDGKQAYTIIPPELYAALGGDLREYKLRYLIWASTNHFIPITWIQRYDGGMFAMPAGENEWLPLK